MTHAELSATLLSLLTLIEQDAREARVHACRSGEIANDARSMGSQVVLPGPGPKPPTQEQMMGMARQAGAMANQKMTEVVDRALEVGKLLGCLPPAVARAYGLDSQPDGEPAPDQPAEPPRGPTLVTE